MSQEFDTGEFIALHVPEEAARARLQRRVTNLKASVIELAVYVHNKHSTPVDTPKTRSWEDCNHWLCNQTRKTLNKDEELML